MSGPVVTQADLDAAADLIEQYWSGADDSMMKLAQATRAGHRQGAFPRAFARHREQSTAPHIAAMEAAAEALAPFAKLGDMANFAFAPALFTDSESLKELPWSEDGKPVTATFGDVRKATKALTQLTAALEAARKASNPTGEE